jgi:hypothetical protein
VYVAAFEIPMVIITLKCQDIQSRGAETVPFEKLKQIDRVLMNYNTYHPLKCSYWFDVLLTQLNPPRKLVLLL